MGLTWWQLGAIWDQLRPACANTSQRGLTWGQLEANMDLKIIEKQLFSVGFVNILRNSVEASGNALEDPLGTPWEAFGAPRGRLGKPWDRLGKPWGPLVEPPWKNL